MNERIYRFSTWCVLILIIGGGMVVAQESEGEPKVSVFPVQTKATQRSTLLAELRKAVEQGNSAEAAGLVRELFSEEPSPTRVFSVMKHSMNQLDFAEFMTDLDEREVRGPAADELLLLLSFGMEDSVNFLERAQLLQNGPGISRQTVRVIAQDAYASQRWAVAHWSFSYLEARYGVDEPWALLAMAEVSLALGKPGEASGVLQKLTDLDPLPVSYRDRALVLQARIHFTHDDQAEEALSILSGVRMGRSRDAAEAHLLWVLIRFVTGSNLEPAELVQAAARRPDLEESNEALAFARLIPNLPEDSKKRRELLASLRYELQEHFCRAATGHRNLSRHVGDPLATLLLVRSAHAFQRCGDDPGALEIWDLLLKDRETQEIALLESGDCFSRMDLPDSAAARYMRLLTEHPESPHAGRARSRLLQ